MHEDDSLIEDEGTGYLISVSDIMAGLLFVFLITLVAFVINFRFATDRQEEARQIAEDRQLQAERVTEDLTNARRLRQELLTDIEGRLIDLQIRVEVDFDHGVLRLTEDAMTFPSGSAELPPAERTKLRQIGSVLIGVLPCYTTEPPAECGPEKKGKLDAVFIEGHTDNVPLGFAVRERFRDNWDLSAQRAMYTYRMLAEFELGVPLLRNRLEQPLFSVSGYGEGRPVVTHAGPTNEPRNRRIDLRFIMSPPELPSEPAPIREIREHGLR